MFNIPKKNALIKMLFFYKNTNFSAILMKTPKRIASFDNMIFIVVNIQLI
ncbi:hypothetical protein T190115A13A_20347 [Tenacibaculum sp. 190524A02b]|uniref:Uncharacterized protein n=1 Tax=Tenacibaculum vairaonense TaxID=3137860 RepID=A0ABP1F9N2_9FLAO